MIIAISVILVVIGMGGLLLGGSQGPHWPFILMLLAATALQVLDGKGSKSGSGGGCWTEWDGRSNPTYCD
ncbi:MAG: hypothetical protein ABTQ31_04545 [Rhizobiaceae bacterium]